MVKKIFIYKVIVLFDTNAIMKIKLKYRKTFILNRKTKQEKG